MTFPTWMYHAEQGAKLFKTAEEYKAAGEGWLDHPDKAKEVKPKRPYKRHHQ